MQFREILQRYHISPLKYDDGTELGEKDYCSLFVILQKYFLSRKIIGQEKVFASMDKLIKKAEQSYERSLLPLEVEDVMDILMEQTAENVVK